MKPEEIKIIERGLLVELDKYTKTIESPVVHVVDADQFKLKGACAKLKGAISKGSMPDMGDIYKELTEWGNRNTRDVIITKFELTPIIYTPDINPNPARGILVTYHFAKREEKKVNKDFNIERYG